MYIYICIYVRIICIIYIDVYTLYIGEEINENDKPSVVGVDGDEDEEERLPSSWESPVSPKSWVMSLGEFSPS